MLLFYRTGSETMERLQQDAGIVLETNSRNWMENFIPSPLDTACFASISYICLFEWTSISDFLIVMTFLFLLYYLLTWAIIQRHTAHNIIVHVLWYGNIQMKVLGGSAEHLFSRHVKNTQHASDHVLLLLDNFDEAIKELGNTWVSFFKGIVNDSVQSKAFSVMVACKDIETARRVLYLFPDLTDLIIMERTPRTVNKYNDTICNQTDAIRTAQYKEEFASFRHF